MLNYQKAKCSHTLINILSDTFSLLMLSDSIVAAVQGYQPPHTDCSLEAGVLPGYSVSQAITGTERKRKVKRYIYCAGALQE